MIYLYSDSGHYPSDDKDQESLWRDQILFLYLQGKSKNEVLEDCKISEPEIWDDRVNRFFEEIEKKNKNNNNA